MTESNGLIDWIGAIIVAFLVTAAFHFLVYPDNPGLIGLVGVSWKILLGILVIVVLGGGVVFGISGGEKLEAMKKEGFTRLLEILYRKIRGREYLAKFLSRYGLLRTPTLPGELPFSLQNMRIELYVLMNYMLRHEIFRAKYEGLSDTKTGGIKKMYEDLSKKEKRLTNNIMTAKFLAKIMRSYVEGARIEKDPEGEGRWEIEINPENKRPAIGWARQDYFVYKLMEELKSYLEKDLTVKDTEQAVSTRVSDAFTTYETQLNNEYSIQIKSYYVKFLAYVKRYRTYNLTRNIRLKFLDMYNMYGSYQRGYGFARKDAKPDIYKIEEGGLGDEGFFREIDWTKVKLDRTFTGNVVNLEPGTNYLEEVNLYGYSITDINQIQVEGRIDTSIRRWKKEDIEYLYYPDSSVIVPRFSHILDFAMKDWVWYINDLSFGTYHRFSKKITDYEILEGYYNLDNAKFKKLLDYEDIAFDREALKNGGKFFYWAKKKYHEGTHDSLLQVKPINPLPTVSMVGLWMFINNFAEKSTKENELAKMYLEEYYKSGYEQLEKKPEKKKTS